MKGKLADPNFRRDRAAKGATERTERTRLIKEIADRLAGVPLSTKSTEELREIVDAAGAVDCCDEEAALEARVNRQQAAREAFYDAAPADTDIRLDEAIQAATCVQISDDVIEAAGNLTQVAWTTYEGARVVLTAAFRAAGFEVVE